MMSRIDRVRRVTHSRRTARTESDRAEEPATDVVNLPVPVGAPGPYQRPPRREFRQGECEVAAQLMAQSGERRGLRAGPPLLDTARVAYNRVEWSGSFDRRARSGRRTRTDI
ncbi:hypothetical protein [Phenylobacterium kunshanense]|uniref:Uncharacterized protein n=1 Tax=Phenylobacterium kunshanense TaxID=1445034 RepID=A0A328BMJ5_9CAUL|nr:hypothetical protein [Phenylobacterium kunshanense]RAK67769.1 hypothetical protein DJ019_07675 [Phenylobacterium kunshanense]